MGGDIIPMMVERNEAGVYDFKRNDVPGSTAKDRDYWRDVGTLASYHEAHLDLVSVEPTFNLYNSAVADLHRRTPQLPGAKFVEKASADDAIVCAGSIVSGATITSVGPRQQRLRRHRRRGRAQRADGQRQDRPGCPAASTRSSTRTSSSPTAFEIGVDPEADRAAGFTVTDEGITVLGKGQHDRGRPTPAPR